MNDIAMLVRLFNPTPDDDFVVKRTSAIADIKARFRKQGGTDHIFSNVAAVATGLASGQLPEPLATNVEASIQKFSSAFVREGQDAQLVVCAFASAREIVTECRASPEGNTGTEVFVSSLLSALSALRPLALPKLEELRQQVVALAAEIVQESAEVSRQRKAIPDFTLAISEGEAPAELARKLKAAVEKVVLPLKGNAALDREELDLLWWALGDWSWLGAGRLSAMSPAAALIAGALETVDRLRRIPSAAHAHVALANVRTDQSLPFEALASAGSDMRARVLPAMKYLSRGLNEPSVFPLLASLFGGGGVDSFQGQSMDALAWCKRLMLEAGTLRLIKSQPA